MYVEHLHLRRSFAFCRVWGSHEDHDLHVHDCLEIGIVLENELEYRFQNQTYVGRPGDVFLCRPFEPHWSFTKPDRPFECVLVLFTPSSVNKMPDGKQLLSPFYTQNGIPPFIPAGSIYADAIKKAAIKAVEAQEQNAASWVTCQYMHLIDILLQVNQYVRESSPAPNIKLPSSEIAEVVGYLLDHFQDPLDLKAVLRRSGMGRTAFFKQFHNLTGLTPNEFVTRLRVQYAMDLLRSTNQSMLDLAYSSGFQSLSTFNKQFKRYTGQSPRDFRKTELKSQETSND